MSSVHTLQVTLDINLLQEAGNVNGMTFQPGIRVPSRHGNSSGNTTLDAGHSERTPMELGPVSSISPLVQPRPNKSDHSPDSDTATAIKQRPTVSLIDSDKDKPKAVNKTKGHNETSEPQSLPPTSHKLTGSGESNEQSAALHADTFGTKREPLGTQGDIITQKLTTQTQVHYPSSAVEETSTITDVSVVENVETSILSPNVHFEIPTAPGFSAGDTETSSPERTSSEGSEDSHFSPKPTFISGPYTEAGFVVPSVNPTSAEVRGEFAREVPPTAVVTPPAPVCHQVNVSVLQEKVESGTAVIQSPLAGSGTTEDDTASERAATEDFAAPRKDPTQVLTNATSTESGRSLSSAGTVAETGKVSASGIEEEEEIEDRLDTFSPDTKTPVREAQESGTEADTDETDEETDDIDLEKEEEVETDTEEEEERNEDDTDIYEAKNQSTPDGISQFSTEDATIQPETGSLQQKGQAANQPPRHVIRQQGAGIKPGSRGQRVRP